MMDVFSDKMLIFCIEAYSDKAAIHSPPMNLKPQ